MKVLFATSELADYARAGGLGEVSAGLPRALRHRNIDIRVLLPGYPEVIAKARDIVVVAHLPGRDGINPCCIGEARTADGLTLYLVLEPSLRGGRVGLNSVSVPIDGFPANYLHRLPWCGVA